MDDARNLAAFLADGRHGSMGWMASTAERRADPQVLWPAARSVIALGLNYGPAADPFEQTAKEKRRHAAISVYAGGRDYHTVVKSRIKALGRWIVERYGCEAKVFVDTAPVMEKPLAMRAGLGWVGKHTNLVSRRYGSWLFLGEVFTSLDLPADDPSPDHCGSCERCMAACPTDALAEPYRIEPRRCLSYLTIEHGGTIDPALEERFGNRVYGCDDCLAACPWNRFATETSHDDLRMVPDRVSPPLIELAKLNDGAFRTRYASSAIKRSGRDRLVRNTIVAIGNSGDPSLMPVAGAAMTDKAEIVRDAAGRAVDRLARLCSEP